MCAYVSACVSAYACVCVCARPHVRACVCVYSRVVCGVWVGGCREKRTCGENGGELGLILELCDGKKFVPVAGLPR